MFGLYEFWGVRILEVAGLQSAFEGICCKHCGSGPFSSMRMFQGSRDYALIHFCTVKVVRRSQQYNFLL